ncbi:unnamed protein product [Echinostoma caproni]|uniref:Uncharacterized protein n=1 Tax=Echinostoma caproni TaxID=27848 RepID=A0A183AQP0_9TREM|nr:unnamed protein product [Echinostoma caproni]
MVFHRIKEGLKVVGILTDVKDTSLPSDGASQTLMLRSLPSGSTERDGCLRIRRHELRLTYSTPRSMPEGPDSSLLPGILGPSTFTGRPAFSDVSTGDWICSRTEHQLRAILLPVGRQPGN